MKVPVEVRISHIVCNQQDDYVELSIEDPKSGVEFISIEMSFAQFGKLIKSGSSIKVDAELRALHAVGKKRVTESRSLVAPPEMLPQYSSTDECSRWLKDNYQELGWNVSTYLGSRGSVVHNRDGTTTLNFSVFRYVEETLDEGS